MTPELYDEVPTAPPAPRHPHLMDCDKCHKNEATVRVTEIVEVCKEGERASRTVQDRHLCEDCTRALDLPHSSPEKKGPLDIWQMIHSAARSQRRAMPACKQCGMDLEEFRRRGRLGCPACYEVFRGPIGELLERVHGARRHVGRVPGVSDTELTRLQDLAQLRQDLEIAIRQEQYEDAAHLRDQIQELESGEPAAEGEAGA